MTIPTDEAPVVDDTAASRFVIREGGTEAELLYALDGDRILLVHTGVPEEWGGRGIGGRLARRLPVDELGAGSLEDLSGQGTGQARADRRDAHPRLARRAGISPPDGLAFKESTKRRVWPRQGRRGKWSKLLRRRHWRHRPRKRER